MAREKAAAVAAASLAANAVLAADTTVVVDDDVLGKPRDHGRAWPCWLASVGAHQCMTAVAVCLRRDTSSELVETEVISCRLTRQTCEAYLATDEPWDKAGAYGIQGLGGAFVSSIRGSYSNVVGLPLCETWQLLAQAATALDAAAA